MATNQLKDITREELEQHDEKSKKQWILVDGLVCDITEYKFEHPGGEDIMLEHAGADATESFENAGHSSNAREKMRALAVGKMSGYEEKKTTKTTTSSSSSTSTSTTTTTSSSNLAYVAIPLIVFGVSYYLLQSFK